MAASVVKAVGAQNTFTDGLTVSGHKRVGISVTGTFSGTVVLQRKVPGAADNTYVDVASWTAVAEKVLENVGNFTYRLGIKTGGYTSGTATCRLSV